MTTGVTVAAADGTLDPDETAGQPAPADAGVLVAVLAQLTG